MVGSNLKALRKNLGKTQEEVAKDLSMHKQTYQNYELNKRQPDNLMLVKLADYFNTTVDYLLGHEVPYLINKSQFSNKQLNIIEKLKTLDNEQCSSLIAYIRGLKDEKNNFKK